MSAPPSDRPRSAGRIAVGLRPIPDFSRYAAGADGSLYRWYPGTPGREDRPGHWKKMKLNGPTISLTRDDGKRVGTSIAQQVLRAWIGPAPIGCEALHYPDPDPRNNRPDNLRWAPRGTSKVGDPRMAEAVRRRTHPERAFHDGDVIEIMRLHAEGITAIEIAETYGVERRAIDNLLSGRTYRHVPRPDGMPARGRRDVRGEAHPGSILTPRKVREIRSLRADGLSQEAIAARIGCGRTAVRKVLNGETWREIQ